MLRSDMSAITANTHGLMCARAKREPNNVFGHEPLNFFQWAQTGSEWFRLQNLID